MEAEIKKGFIGGGESHYYLFFNNKVVGSCHELDKVKMKELFSLRDELNKKIA